MTLNYLSRVAEAAAHIRPKLTEVPRLMIILGSGLNAFADTLSAKQVIPFRVIPHFPEARVAGHRGNLIIGTWQGVPLLVLDGRIHYYEGYDMNEVTFPIHLAHRLGVPNLVVTNAAGGINQTFAAGDIMMITDHLNFIGLSPLRSLVIEGAEDFFTDMTDAYHQPFFPLIREAAEKAGVAMQEGVYIGVAGPNYETRAEIRAFRVLGADAVGMSTVPEVIIANYYKMKVCGFSLIANVAADRHVGGIDHGEVLDTVRAASERFVSLLQGVVARIGGV